MAHQRVERGDAVRRAAEEHRRVAEHLLQHGCSTAPSTCSASVCVSRSTSVRDRRRTPAVSSRSGSREGRVEERVEGVAVGLRRGLRVPRASPLRRPAPAPRTSSSSPPRPARRRGARPARRLGEQPVRRIQPYEVDVVLDPLPQQRERVREHLRHEVPGRPGVEPEPVELQQPRPPADPVVLLEQGHARSTAGEQGRGGQAGDPSADDDDASGHRPARACVRTASPTTSSLVGVDSRTRRSRISSGVHRAGRRAAAGRARASRRPRTGRASAARAAPTAPRRRRRRSPSRIAASCSAVRTPGRVSGKYVRSELARCRCRGRAGS